jgi:hypothetical protein
VERQVASRRNVALMFGHVGRRTQNLVGRQVALIDKLEHEETNPGRLRDLYRLDHVSSRLRRSASSLVVLSGATGADEHMTPAGIGDVARLAVAEIEDYTRVDVETATTLRVVPALIGDLILLIAELMENATASSPPGTRVVVSAIPTPEGARLTVVDHGIGMTESRLDQENARLTSRERIDLAPTEVLGLFVVGRLARRHGLRVALSSTRGGGVTATVDIPSRLLALAVPPAATGPGAAVPVQVARRIERRHDGAPTGVLAIADPKLFDIDALRRADQTMQTVRPWNAFDARRDVPAGSSVAGAEAAAIPRQRENGPGLNRRVPGATLRGLEGVGPAVPTGARAQWTSQPGSLDAGQVRDSLADFESGVARALEELDAPQWPT